jgi:uncharacterized protein (DUF2384 family)
MNASPIPGKNRDRLVVKTKRKRERDFSVKAVRSGFGLKQGQMSRMLGVSLRTLSQLESTQKAVRPDTSRRLTEADRLRRALCEIMDAADLPEWMERPNPAFEGSTPLQVVERGEIDRLWQMVYAVRTGQPL